MGFDKDKHKMVAWKYDSKIFTYYTKAVPEKYRKWMFEQCQLGKAEEFKKREIEDGVVTYRYFYEDGSEIILEDDE